MRWRNKLPKLRLGQLHGQMEDAVIGFVQQHRDQLTAIVAVGQFVGPEPVDTEERGPSGDTVGG